MTNKLMPSDFVHLHNHTQHSLLDGMTKIPELMEFVNKSGMSAIAMTDHGTMSGAIDFYKEGINHEVKPLIGLETYIASRKHTDKEPSKDKNRYHLILIAMNKVGYQNLMKLSTIANLDGFYYYPRIDHDLLEKYNEGLIVLSGCMGSEVGDAIKNDQLEKARDIAKWYKKIFGDRYYMEIQDHGHPDNPLTNSQQQEVNENVITIANDLKIDIVVTCDAHYLTHDDQDAHEILLCVGTGSFLSDEKRMSLKQFPLHVVSPEEIISRWGNSNPEYITNTKKIAERCRLELDLGNILIPKFPLPVGKSEKSYLNELVWVGVIKRYLNKNIKISEKKSIEQYKKKLKPEVVERTNYELGIINEMGFNGYFLIIHDFINWGKNKGIVFGPGRGSAAGSIIAYSLYITELDPLEYDLLFERFLNPDRISMPDIDIDIQDSRRDEVIDYCIEKYGKDRVANIVTFGRMQARNAVRDVARVLQVPYSDADRLAKMIPQPIQGRHIPLEKSILEDHDLKEEYESNNISKTVLDQAIKLEGTIRSHGVHAAGVVIAPDDIVKFTPLEMAQKGVVSTQYSMGPIEELGLLKMDFLGLSNLTIIKNTTRIVKKVYGINLNINEIPLNDLKTFELLQRGDTTGVFQLESSGMKRYLKDLSPTVFEDIVAMVALYRPGPMQFIEDFVERKHGRRNITYAHPKMEEALKTTYGVLVYQEQVMQISKDLCGFSGGDADTLRKGIAKKIPEVLDKMKIKFIDGAIKNSGASKNDMEKFWKQLEDFAAYCFNKSHAACYGMISYWTAYLKANYPAAFMAALMTSDYDDIDRLAIEITECKNMGIEVLPPDINESFNEFAVVKSKNKIRFGLHAIKNVGSNAVDEILRARDDNGPFESLEDFFSTVNPRIVNKKSLESLIKSGAFDRFGERSILLGNLELFSAFANKIQKDINSGQTDIFGSVTEEFSVPKIVLNNSVPAIDTREQLLWERELLGLYLSQNPLQAYEAILLEKTVPLKTIKSSHDGKSANIGGAITDVREITTKNGQKMAFVKLADMTGEIELVLFPSTYQQTTGIWERDRVVLVKGKINTKDKDGSQTNEIKLLVDDAREITHEQASAYQPTGKKLKEIKESKPKQIEIKQAPKVYIRLESSSQNDKLLSIKSIIDNHPGKTEVVLVIGSSSKQIIKLPNTINLDTSIPEFTKVLGEDHVKVK